MPRERKKIKILCTHPTGNGSKAFHVSVFCSPLPVRSQTSKTSTQKIKNTTTKQYYRKVIMVMVYTISTCKV
jgi:hypothetical protein